MSALEAIIILRAVKKKRSDPFTPSIRSPVREERRCDMPGCAAPGQYRAPRSRHDLTSYFWFCLEHVRSYNASWNYYAGMNESEIEKQIRSDVTWWRPTWPLGVRSLFQRHVAGEAPPLHFGAFAARDWTVQTPPTGGGEVGMRPRPGSDQERALAVFDLDPPVTQETIKARYKNLVKRHHPDANGGDKDAEERLKLINQAYAALKHGIRL